MNLVKEYKTIIGMIIMGAILVALYYFSNDCNKSEPVQPLSQKYGIEEEVALWKTMLEEENKVRELEKTKHSETHIDIDDLSFDQAFELMRRMKGKDETFYWHGAKYTTLLESEIPKNWVEAGGDIDDNFYCPDNYIDECGVCGGEGIRSWYVDNDGDGIGDPNTLVRTCEKPL